MCELFKQDILNRYLNAYDRARLENETRIKELEKKYMELDLYIRERGLRCSDCDSLIKWGNDRCVVCWVNIIVTWTLFFWKKPETLLLIPLIVVAIAIISIHIFS